MGPPRYPSGLATEEAEASHRLHQLANVTGVTQSGAAAKIAGVSPNSDSLTSPFGQGAGVP